MFLDSQSWGYIVQHHIHSKQGTITGSWGQFSHLLNSLLPPSQPQAPSISFRERVNGLICDLLPWGKRTHSSSLSPTCCHLPVPGVQSQQLRAPAWARSRRQVGGAWFHPLHAPHRPHPVLVPSAAAPSSSRPPGQPPPSSSLLTQCCISSLKTRLGTGGRGKHPRRGSGI